METAPEEGAVVAVISGGFEKQEAVLPGRVGDSRGHGGRLARSERLERPLLTLPTGSLMLRAGRHNLQVFVRLAALLVLLGLGTVPVECAAVYGPHSVFVSAEEVAELRSAGETSTHQHVATPSSPSTAVPMVDHEAMKSEHKSSHAGAHDAESGARASVPGTATTVTDALVSLALIDTPVGLPASASMPLPLFHSQPVNHLLPSPEPPPP